MDGIEKIKARISQDMESELAAIEEKTRQECQAILEESAAQAQKEYEEILTRGKKAAQERRERLESAAGMETRKLRLAAKQEVLGEAFEMALDRLCSMSDEAYTAMLTDLVLRASSTGREKLIFSLEDRSRIGKQVVLAANDALVKQRAPELPSSVTDSKVGAFLGKVVNNTTALVTGTGLLTLSEQTREMRGGFILADGDVEINCTFETLLRLQREALEKEVAQTLFD